MNDEDTEKSLPRNSSLRIRHQGVTLAVACLTAMLMAFTIFFAYNSSLEQPYSSLFVSKRPERSILVLNLSSQLTLFALAELTASVFDAARWALACRSSGTTALTFITLSRATSFIGALYMSLGKSEVSGLSHSHRIWGAQRVLMTILRVVLGIILLSDVSFQPTYRSVHQIPVLQAGLTPMNASFAQADWFSSVATDYFWFYYPALLADGKISRSVEPLTCSGDSCNAFFLPGSLSMIVFNDTLPNITTSDYPTATSYIQQDAPGYQIDYSPIDANDDPPLTLDDCEVYGLPGLALQVCLKKSNSSLLAAWNSCPYASVGQINSCLNTTAWREVAPSSTKMTINGRRASTVYSRSNFTIMDFTDLSAPFPVIYDPEDFFGFYNVLLSVNLSQTNWQFSTQFSLLFSLATFLEDSSDTQIDTGSDSRQLRLQEFLATPIAIFNDALFGGSAEDMGNSLVLATPSYRLVIAPVTLYLFMIGGLLSLSWCLVVLALSMARQTPATTLFPEVDFASKIVRNATSVSRRSFQYLLSQLSNSNSYEIRRNLAPARFFVRVSGASGARVGTMESNDNYGLNKTIFQ